jgi:cation diffusion facilitator CzcD-associated flavoprotein CzcO
MSLSTVDDPRENSAAIAEELGWTRVNERGYEILEQPCEVPSAKRVIVIGAGATGLSFAKFAEEMPRLDVQIYEKNTDIAGTWWENVYPGCACDIPAHIYQFMWALNPHWSHYYVGAQEILEYFHDVADKHGLRKYVKVRHEVVHARWDSSTSKWTVELKGPGGAKFTDTCDFLVNGSGLLNNWKWPEIKGLHSFQGTLTHSAAYDQTIQYEGKRVAVFGAGSSGVQIVAKLQPSVKHLYTWIRSPMWVSSGFAGKFAGPDGANFKYSQELKQKFASDPVAHLRYIKMLDDELGKRYIFNMINSPETKQAVEYSKRQMEGKLKTKPELIKKMIPTYFGIGCRRPTPGNGYLEALVSPNVTAYTEEVREITPAGFIDYEGKEHEVDIIICATGFNTSFVPRFPVLADDKSLREIWKTDPVSYFSVLVPDFPNYFTSLGPYAATNGSLLPPIEHGCRYILQIIKKCQLEGITSIAPKAEVTHEFREHSDLLLKRTVWNQKCRSWFKNGTIDGLPRIYPGSRAHFIQNMQPRYEDFVIKYNCVNRFQFMGNGFSMRDLDGRDSTWYLGIVDGEDKDPDYTNDEKEIYKLSNVSK